MGKGLVSLLAHGCIRQEYRVDLRRSKYIMYGRGDSNGEVVLLREEDTITSHIEDLEELIVMMKEEMDHSLITTHNLIPRKADLEEELQDPPIEHEEEINVLQEKFDDLRLQLDEAKEKIDNKENLQDDHSYGGYVSQEWDYEDDDEDI
ncbi:hypothetical protein ZWY2020_035714 [Hordeum vulgare]|nr:hypothetical protein ZWY2020_035714 [Hordeum vulgare]